MCNIGNFSEGSKETKNVKRKNLKKNVLLLPLLQLFLFICFRCLYSTVNLHSALHMVHIHISPSPQRAYNLSLWNKTVVEKTVNSPSPLSIAIHTILPRTLVYKKLSPLPPLPTPLISTPYFKVSNKII